MSHASWIAGLALTLTLTASACSSDESTSAVGSAEGGDSNAGGEGPDTASSAGAPDLGMGGAAGSGDAGGPGTIAPADPGYGGGSSAGPALTCLPNLEEISVAVNGLHYYLEAASAPDPDITLCRGNTYTFVLDKTVAGHPFYIKSKASSGTADAFADGVTGNGKTSGKLTFAVPTTAPDNLYYQSASDLEMGGKLIIFNNIDIIPEN